MLLIILLLVAIANSKLAYVATVFRHGARYPLADIYDGAQTKKFHGQLTSVGMRQHFLLGGYLKAEYIDRAKLINSTLFPKEVQVFTDSSERCVESAVSHLVGLFPFGTGPKLPEGIDSKYLNPPFESFLQENLRRSNQNLETVSVADYALKLGFQPVPFFNATRFFPGCPNENKLIAKRLESQAVKLAEFQLVHAAFTEKMRIMFNLKTEYSNVGGLADLFDVIICDLNLGRPMPASFSDSDLQQLRYIQNYLFVFLYEGFLAPIYSTDVVEGILKNMDNVIKNGDKEVKRYSIYSGHDTNVVPLILFFNLTSHECISKKWKNETVNGNCADSPPFASNLIFELHQNDSNPTSYFVKLRYNGEYYNVCGGNSKQCEYSQFAARSRAQYVDVNKQCGITKGINEAMRTPFSHQIVFE